jgi:signal transduction histidine kinase
LKSPLSPLKGYLTLIRRSKTVSDPQVMEMAIAAEAGANRMAEMIEALLRFCRAGTPVENAVGDLDIAVSTILTELDQVAAKEKVRLERRLESSITVACSAQLVQSIADNLLSNAVKYSAGRSGARVVVEAYRDGSEAVLKVRDNGRGMSAESLHSLFRPFFRAPEARGIPGHGLGLATTKRLVEAHQGRISVQSKLGVGTEVTVRLPLASTPTQPAARSKAQARGVAAPATAAEIP